MKMNEVKSGTRVKFAEIKTTEKNDEGHLQSDLQGAWRRYL